MCSQDGWHCFDPPAVELQPDLSGSVVQLLTDVCMTQALACAAYPPDWDNGSYLAYGIYEPDGSGVYIAYNPYGGPVPAILPPPPYG